MENSQPLVVLVNEDDSERGTMPKLPAHEPPGELHRAISVFVVDDAGRYLIQRRASGKYHFPGIWANACCSHPKPGENVADAGTRRLQEELGINAETRAVGWFIYEATCPNSGLIERELDHVLLAHWTGEPELNPEEADASRWITEAELLEELATKPEQYSPWLPLAFQVLLREQAQT